MLVCCYNLQDMIRRLRKHEKRRIFVGYICLCMYINYGLMCLCLNRRRCSYIACKMQNHNNDTCSCVTTMLSSNQPHLSLLWFLLIHFPLNTYIFNQKMNWVIIRITRNTIYTRKWYKNLTWNNELWTNKKDK